MLYVGLISKSRNIETFLKLPIKGLKRIIGDGPHVKELSRKYPYAEFLPTMDDKTLAGAMSQANVLVFPSKNRRLEAHLVQALACGLPIAGYPTDLLSIILDRDGIGCCNTNLELAVRKALHESNASKCAQRSFEIEEFIGYAIRSHIV